jgi:hypothetical protein
MVSSVCSPQHRENAQHDHKGYTTPIDRLSKASPSTKGSDLG